MIISVDEAREYFLHPSQTAGGLDPNDLPKEGFEYHATEWLCLIFHLAPWPDVWMVHFAAKPEGWGYLVPHAEKLLNEFWRSRDPERIIGWTPEKNRAACAFARRCGFEVDGRMSMKTGNVILHGWSA